MGHCHLVDVPGYNVVLLGKISQDTRMARNCCSVLPACGIGGLGRHTPSLKQDNVLAALRLALPPAACNDNHWGFLILLSSLLTASLVLFFDFGALQGIRSKKPLFGDYEKWSGEIRTGPTTWIPRYRGLGHRQSEDVVSFPQTWVQRPGFHAPWHFLDTLLLLNSTTLSSLKKQDSHRTDTAAKWLSQPN